MELPKVEKDLSLSDSSSPLHNKHSDATDCTEATKTKNKEPVESSLKKQKTTDEGKPAPSGISASCTAGQLANKPAGQCRSATSCTNVDKRAQTDLMTANESKMKTKKLSVFDQSQLFYCPGTGHTESMAFEALLQRMHDSFCSTYPDNTLDRALSMLFNLNRTMANVVGTHPGAIQPQVGLLKTMLTNVLRVREVKPVGWFHEHPPGPDQPDPLARYQRVRKSVLESRQVLPLAGVKELLETVGFVDDPDRDFYVYQSTHSYESRVVELQHVVDMLDKPNRYVLPVELDRQVTCTNDYCEQTDDECGDEDGRRRRDASPLYTRLTFRYVDDGQMKRVMANFRASDSLIHAKSWFMERYVQHSEWCQIFHNHEQLDTQDQMDMSLTDLWLSPSATLFVVTQ